MRSVPIIDISSFRNATDKLSVAAKVAAACENIGFLVVTGHGIDPALLRRCMAAMSEFFALSTETKRQYISPDPSVFRGYFPMDEYALAAAEGDKGARPDLRESYCVQRVDIDRTDPYYASAEAKAYYAPNIWPSSEDAPDFRAAFGDYYRAMERLSADMMALFALALGLPENFFADKINHHMTNLVAFHYPPLTRAPQAGQMRGGAHTDFGSLSIVYGEPSIKGLQVKLDGTWYDVPDVPGGFVINIGDLMAQWTNDKWVSTWHRVANPPREEWSRGRNTLIFFHSPNYDAEIECLPLCATPDRPPRYPSETAAQHLMRKMRAMSVNAAQ